MKTVPAGVFKAKCLAILDEVNATGEPVLITKRGKPVASVVMPIQKKNEKPPRESIFGFLKGYGSIPKGVDLVESMFSDEEWKRFEDIEINRIHHGEPE